MISAFEPGISGFLCSLDSDRAGKDWVASPYAPSALVYAPHIGRTKVELDDALVERVMRSR